MTDRKTDTLEDLFAAARADPPAVPDALIARVLADAARVQPRAPLWRRIVDGIGGPVGLGGVVTGALAGMWIGFAPPSDTLDPLAVLVDGGALATVELTETFYDFGWEAEEG
ncbi:hypothetical protein KDD17_09415 [Sulfitobacter albidus]|uniref:Dihydroorotate dehydrogenase n=1 Tax=Sulfitobacter albidus TaxID=2829501 RepID=A0A975JBH9_9RHOB|nr:hypothetical protein [Sulfitobacter albidus]QUJ75236.1 hypothetical protein KDD17_09415 [Sulfitobacter albidus]